MRDQTPFDDLDRYLELPRVSGLVGSPDGRHLVTAVAELNDDRTRYVNSLWRIDPDGIHQPRRLTRSEKGESHPAFTPDGTLLFVSDRADPADSDEDEPLTRLMGLPVDGGEAHILITRRGGFDHIDVATERGTVVVTSPTLPGSGPPASGPPGSNPADDDQRRKERKDRKINAVLHSSYPIRYWDTDLGPDHNRLFVADWGDAPDSESGLDLRDLTPEPGRALDGAEFAVSPDGGAVITTWWVPTDGGRRLTLQTVNPATGSRQALLDDVDREYFHPRVSPDSTRMVAVSETLSTVDQPPRFGLVVVDLDDTTPRDVATPIAAAMSWPVWTPDGKAVLVSADHQGRRPVFRIDVADGTTTRLTGDDGAYDDIVISPDGSRVCAIRSAIDAPPTVVALDSTTPDQQPRRLPSPGEDVELPGSLAEVTATATDGTPLRSWLCLPVQASAAMAVPLLLWVHGGPLSSWNDWSWRWNPWLMVANGYAVLLPDPALSTGYGDGFIARGWGAWGQAPYTDLMTLTDATLERDDVDATRTAAMGGSFGGYMANWIAGHTDRFDAIVTHASLWALDQFGPTTDAYDYWRRELSPQMALDNSPHRHVDAISTPMLVIHGDKDYRVPIGEGLRLWAELAERHQRIGEAMPHRFLMFPDENHWVLKPQHARLWYQTVFAFLEWHVLGEDWHAPDLLT